MIKLAQNMVEGKAEDNVVISVAVAYLLVATVGLFVSFSGMSRHLSLLAGGFETGRDTSYWLWLRYGFDQLFSHILFGISSIFGWSISEIQPTMAWARALVLAFNVELDVLVLASVLYLLRVVSLKRANLSGADLMEADLSGTDLSNADLSRTVPQKIYWKFVFINLGKVLLFLLWVFPLAIGIDAVVRERLVLTSTCGWLFLTLISAAFTWSSLHALVALQGRGNKFCAFLGIAAGIALIWISFHHLTFV